MYITQPLHRALQQHPDRTALICGSRQTSFRQLADRVARLAGGLRGLGMQDGDRVAILALNSDRYFEYLIGVPWGGGVINPCNTRWSVAELAYSLSDSGSRILLVDDMFQALAPELKALCETLDVIIHIGDAATPPGMVPYEALVAGSDPMADTLRRDEDLLGLFYTGGTTGAPKGVMLSHANFMSSALALAAEGIITPGGVFLHAAPMFHLADLGCSSVAWILGNAHSFIPCFSPPAVVEAIERDLVTDTLLVPTMVQMLVDHPVMAEGRDISSLRTILYGGSAISEAVLDRALATLKNVSFCQAYGMTELAPVAAILAAAYHRPEGRRGDKLRSGGRAAYCTEIRVADLTDNPLPAGVKGEVLVRGPNVMKGYWNKPELTAAALRGGWMHTGDVGYIDGDGFLFIIDRLKDMIISGGENIYSAEVENALARHAAVQTCAIIGIPSDKWGEAVHGFVILKPGQTATQDELIAHCRQMIAGYKCPRSIEFVDALPLSGPGKILKTELRKRFWSSRDQQVS
ncbi:long-chain-fatty-acid--CoA ligase [Niveispirillum sp.]|uniref:long-chain-fatty-acid--CoA ligase n=1 Tax=Niveispirillum sp. TaxID=1917217 RepID=UPI001B7254EE|nr:long-chain-fatty-acid--CoA ligase [Niveispirillum sp.]MBP7334299.1 long-chain-fatty-acid--CoA ligase [Niveispirillum sp.]